MDDLLYEMIFRRKSFHIFRNTGNECISEEERSQIEQLWNHLKPLDPSIRTALRIVPAEETSCARGEEYCILFYSEEKEGYLQNIGYLGEQLDLYLASKNIGTLWFGIGKTEEPEYEGLSFVIMMAVRKIDDPAKFRKNMFKSKRKTADEIWEGEQIPGVTDIVRFAPSACNTQPWHVMRNGNTLTVYRYRKPGKRGIMPADKVTYYNRMDTGIFLCFLELCLKHQGIEFTRKLYPDNGGEAEMTLNAGYVLNQSACSKEHGSSEDNVHLSDDSSGFVSLSEAVPDVLPDIRYYSSFNFIGERIDGYEEPLAILTKEAAEALAAVSDEVKTMGYRLRIFDAYRPQKAVTHFMRWAEDIHDTRMKEYFYPGLDKESIIPQGYVAEHSGHSRGSTVDLTLFDMKTQTDLDMGCTFDLFGELSHPDCGEVTEQQYDNRMYLRKVMMKYGFMPIAEEWWHFTLADEPYPDTYFTFPVSRDSLKK